MWGPYEACKVFPVLLSPSSGCPYPSTAWTCMNIKSYTRHSFIELSFVENENMTAGGSYAIL